MDQPPAVAELAESLRALGWVTDLFVGGSLATGDHRPGVSDIDLVAITRVPLDAARLARLRTLHRRLDATTAAGADLGCAYVAAPLVDDPTARHPTWTHGRLVTRPLSGIARAELVRHGHAVLGRPPASVLGDVSEEDVRRAARAELAGYWTTAVRRPLWWWDPALVDLGLTTMARARHALATGELLTKTAALETLRAPDWLREQVRARRDGVDVRSPRLRAAAIAWSDARRTTADARA